MLTNALVVVGYVLFYLSPSPNHWLVFVSISISSFGFYGLLTMGYVMVNQHCGHSARGSVMGLNCLFGAIAILTLSKAGGIAFDKIDKSAPFLGVAFFSFIMIFIVFLRRKDLDTPIKKCPVNH
jgi:predicted MFS family arabinose efflux permease